jgi:hypothetical protein
MLSFSIKPREVGVGILQHRILISMAELTTERAMLRTLFAVVCRRIVFHCALAHSFIRTISYRVAHRSLLLYGLRNRMIAPDRKVVKPNSSSLILS